MENPVEEIAVLIHILTQAPPTKQKEAIERYFTPDAAFTHPFCATKSWSFNLPFLGELSSRLAIIQIYQWYKIMSPTISLEVERITFNSEHLKLYVDVHQHFQLWFVPLYDADVRLTTVLDLVTGNETNPHSPLLEYDEPIRQVTPNPNTSVADSDRHTGTRNGKTMYYISSQNDLYQTSDWIKFIIPWCIGHTIVVCMQLFATMMCIIGSFLFIPQTWWKEKSFADMPQKI